MTNDISIRILRDRIGSKTWRENYWDSAGLLSELRRALSGDNAGFRRHAREEFARYMLENVTPVIGEHHVRARAAATWLLRAQAATPDDGVSLGYFPCRSDSPGWQPSYPETTGYIITSLLAFADRFGEENARAAAVRMARWEVAVQMPSGAVQGGPICGPGKQSPAAFNTGMVLDGLSSICRTLPDPDLVAGARRAADFLVSDLDDAGYFRTNGAFVRPGEIKTYTCLCAWALYRFGELVREDSYRAAATRSIEAALRQQHPNGWFAHNCLTRSDAPLTHTIGYTLQGILEVGMLARRSDFVEAVQRTLDAITPRIRANGYLPGRFYADWQPAAVSACLTGSVQIALVAFRIFQITGRQEYRDAGDRLTNFVKACQALDTPTTEINGCIGGSFPVFGEYMRGGYPNWATKYYLDALLMQEAIHRAAPVKEAVRETSDHASP